MYRMLVICCGAVWLAAAVPCVSAQPWPAAPVEISLAQPNAGMRAVPLLMARQNLLLARSRVLELQYREAVPALLATAQALASFAQEEPGPNGKYADFTRQRMQDYAAVIENDPGDAVRRIDNWMDRIRQWGGGM